MRNLRGLRRVPALTLAIAAVLVYQLAVGATPLGELFAPIAALQGVLAAVLVAWWVGRLARDHDGLDVAVLVGFVLFLVVVLASDYARMSFESLLVAGTTASLTYHGRRWVRDRRVRIGVVLAMGLFCAAVALFMAVAWVDLWGTWLRESGWSEWPPRTLHPVPGPFGHQHLLAAVLAMTAPALLGTPFRGWLRPVAVIGVASTALLLAMIVPRTVLVAGAAATLVVLGTRSRRMRLDRRLIAAIAVGVGAIALGAVVSGLFAAIIGRLDNPFTLVTRARLSMASLEAWQMSVVDGHGPGAWALEVLGTPAFNASDYLQRDPDSVLAQVLVEGGLIGVIALAVPMFVIGKLLWRRRRRAARPLWFALFLAGTCLALNPSDFAYTGILVAAWVALALPARRVPAAGFVTDGRPIWRAAAAIGCAVLIGATLLRAGGEMAFAFARTSLERGDLSGGRTWLGHAVEVDPRNALYLRSVAYVELAAGRADLAIRWASRAVAESPNDVVAVRLLSVAHLVVGDLVEARRFAAAASELRPWSTRSAFTEALAAAGVERQRHLATAVIADPLLLLAAWPDAAVGSVEDAASGLRQFGMGLSPPSSSSVALASLFTGIPLNPDAGAEQRPLLVAPIRALQRCAPNEAWGLVLDSYETEAEAGTYWVIRSIASAATGSRLAATRAQARLFFAADAPATRAFLIAGDILTWQAYHRPDLLPLDGDPELPSRNLSLLRLLDDPNAWREMGLANGCR